MRNASGRSFRKNQNTSCSIFFLENHTIYEIRSKNTVGPGRPHVTIWRMRIACWISKATDIHIEYVVFIAFLLQKLLHERALMLQYTYMACLVISLVSVSYMISISIFNHEQHTLCEQFYYVETSFGFELGSS
jgi:hypothetical protein